MVKSLSAVVLVVKYSTDKFECADTRALPTSLACIIARALPLDTILIFLCFFNSLFVQIDLLFVISTGQSNKLFDISKTQRIINEL